MENNTRLLTHRPSKLIRAESACKAAIVYTHHRHVVLLSPKDDTFYRLTGGRGLRPGLENPRFLEKVFRFLVFLGF